MKILGIETSTAAGSLALVKDGHPIGEISIDTNLDHSSRLIPVLDELLSGAGWDINDLEGIGVGLGPGSFTGLRVGLAAGRGIASGIAIPLVGVGSFAALARGSTAPEGVLTPLLGARRGCFYIARYRKSAGGIEELTPPKIVVPRDMVEACRDAWIVSPEWESLKGRLEEITGGMKTAGGEKNSPRAIWIAILAEEKLQSTPLSEIEAAEPIYLSGYYK